MNNIRSLYNFAKDNPELVDYVCPDTVVDGGVLLSNTNEDDNKHDGAKKEGDDDDNGQKEESSSANKFGTNTPSSQSDLTLFTLFTKI